MLAPPTLDRLNAMGLSGIARAFDELTANAEVEQLSHVEWLSLLLDREWSWRYDRNLAARLRFAKLRHQTIPEDVDYRSARTRSAPVPPPRQSGDLRAIRRRKELARLCARLQGLSR